MNIAPLVFTCEQNSTSFTSRWIERFPPSSNASLLPSSRED